ncbi:hypothetical protein QU481_12870 [Crenobacter sp. SG2303]|uniref:Uncharacterized protein n=1 Tax=Crenobacter oryzisoli TaxID=3056844 RepID=A0ABT7XPQ8_9NEIS|nr:hypothetical protein [Crenobacter sp. SG2303]MDN0075778.1 hypothetical protein [Crenobacter sp. SG2303]
MSDLPVRDLVLIGGQPNIEEWADSNIWRQAKDSGMEVVKDWSSQAAQGGKELVERAMKRLMLVFK